MGVNEMPSLTADEFLRAAYRFWCIALAAFCCAGNLANAEESPSPYFFRQCRLFWEARFQTDWISSSLRDTCLMCVLR